MKAKHELVAIAVMLVICLLFAACAQKAEEKLTDKATDPALISSTAEDDEGENEEEPESEENADGKEQSETDEKEMSITPDAALEELKYFYGSLYTVKETGKKDNMHYYTVTDNNGKKYADVTVDTTTANITETLADGTVNEWNMLV